MEISGNVDNGSRTDGRILVIIWILTHDLPGIKAKGLRL